MTTFYSTMTMPETNTIPDWMREERYMYCDQFCQDLWKSKTTSIWRKVKSFFS